MQLWSLDSTLLMVTGNQPPHHHFKTVLKNLIHKFSNHEFISLSGISFYDVTNLNFI